MFTPEELKARREARKAAREAAKEAARIEAEKNQRPVKSITITIEWRKSRIWGNNPHATAEVNYKGDEYPRFERRDGFTCSGCGYDKESTVIAEIFNAFLKYKLWQLAPEKRKGGHGSGDNGPAPYGICVYSDNNPHYGGGIGTDCYTRPGGIGEYIGGKFESIGSGKTFDVYKYTDN
jgi:hypothetical protein